jgi:D-alanyl-D-alanine carboxypeptidase
VADVKSGRPIRRNDHLRTASTGKTFSGAVALRLVDEGSLSLDSTIGETLPELPAAWGAVTLRQLLQHTGGVPDYTKSPAWQAYVAAHLHQAVSVPPEFLIGFVAGQPLGFTPGSSYRYSNTDNVVIQLMAEAATGQTYKELLRKLVFSPLGLTQTSAPSGLQIPSPYVHGYDLSPPAPPEDVSGLIDPSLVAAGPGGMVSTPVDLNRFIRAYASGRLIDRSTKLSAASFEVPPVSRPDPGRTRAASPYTATRPIAARCSAIPATFRATPCLSPRLQMAAALLSCPPTRRWQRSSSLGSSSRCAARSASASARR